MKIGYLGPLGSYSYEAACRHSISIGVKSELVALPDFTAIVTSVERGVVDTGIIPVENSTHGAVAAAMDSLLRLAYGCVCGEMVIDIEHCLLSDEKGAAEIKCVFTHEQALGQCYEFFRKHCSDIEFIMCSSTSQACEMAKKNGRGYGAIAGKTAAGVYNLAIVADGIQDNGYNQTRFLIIGSEKPAASGNDKTSIVFSFHDDCPGSLYGVLKVFADRNINLTRIESRPAKNTMGKYIFYIDFTGHIDDNKCIEAVTEIRCMVSWLKVLGSYPAAQVLTGKKI